MWKDLVKHDFHNFRAIERKEKNTRTLEDVCVDSAWIFDYKIVIPSRESFVFLKNNNSNPPPEKKNNTTNYEN